MKKNTQTPEAHKRMFADYNKYKDLKGRYNAGKIEGNIFTLYRIKDGSTVARFDLTTFEAVN